MAERGASATAPPVGAKYAAPTPSNAIGRMKESERSPDDLENQLSAAEAESLHEYVRQAESKAMAVAERCAAMLTEILAAHPAAGFQALPSEEARSLRSCIVEFASVQRATGATPEAAVIAIKRIVRATEHPAGGDSSLLMESAVTWMIEGYYGGSFPPTVPG